MNVSHHKNGHPQSTRGKAVLRLNMLSALSILLLAGCATPSTTSQGDGTAFQFKLLDAPTSEAVAMAPTSTPTSVPADTPEPTDTPIPTDTPEPTDTPTPEPTDTPIPTDTPTPVPTDTPEPTPEPTDTPEPTPEPTDTPEPTPEPTDTPEPTPEPTATPEPTLEPTPEPEVNVDEPAAEGGVKLTVRDLLGQSPETPADSSDASAEAEESSEDESSADVNTTDEGTTDEGTTGEDVENEAESSVRRLGDLLNQSDEAEAPTSPTSDNDGTFVQINTDGRKLNVRRDPDSGAGILTSLESGTVVEITQLSDDGSWGQISTDLFGSGGWISLQFTLPAESSSGSPEASATDEATTEETATEETPGGREGESSADDDDEADDVAASQTFTVPTAITQPENMNVRGGPGTVFDVVTVAPAGTQYEILGATPDGTWYQVRLPDEDEAVGWVSVALTETAGPADAIPTLDESEIPTPPEPEVDAQTEQLVAVAGPSVPTARSASTAGFFGYGVQAHMLGGGIDAATSATQGMGFNWIKQQVEWRIFEGSPGALDFSELRRIVDSAGSRGISVLFSVVNAPDWAREAGFDASVGGPPVDPQTYANFVGRLAGDFCGSSLQAIEVWNEQNLHYEWGNKPLNPAEYMNLLRAAYGSIKSACPSMLVISGALTPTGPNGNFAMDDFAYLEQMYQNGLAGYADGIGAHPSGYNVPASVRHTEACATIQQTGNYFNGPCDTPHHSWSFLSTMEGYRNIMNVYGDSGKRIWPTEFGWAAGGAFDPRYAYADDNSYEEQAAWTVEAFQMMRSWGWVGPAFLWNLNFRVVADGTEKAQWGIVRNDYSPLPIYDALRNMPK